MAAASLLGGFVMDRTLPEDLTGVQAYGAWGIVVFLCLVGVILALWPEKRAMPLEIKGNRFSGVMAAIKATTMNGVSVTDNVSSAETFIDADTINGGEIRRNIHSPGAPVYQNNGVNNGHIGPVTNVGKQPFQMTGEVLQQALEMVGSGTRIKVWGIGRLGAEIAPQIGFHLIAHGCDVSTESALQMPGLTAVLTMGKDPMTGERAIFFAPEN